MYLFRLAVVLLLVADVCGFGPVSFVVSHPPAASSYFPRTSLLFSTVAPVDSSSATTVQEPTTWDCNEEAICVPVPACDDTTCRTSLDVRIHGQWYDLSGWRKAHPAGAQWIDWYDGRDATEVMDAFHSQKARDMYKRLPKSKVADMLEATTAPDSTTQLNFRKLFNQLEKDGWWERDLGHEAIQLGIWAALVVTAVATVHSVPFVSMVSLALSMTAAGWLGHDYIHGIDDFSFRMRNFASYAGGLSPTWWSDKVCEAGKTGLYTSFVIAHFHSWVYLCIGTAQQTSRFDQRTRSR
jgi:cytochrome b involved in lipid metabolism